MSGILTFLVCTGLFIWLIVLNNKILDIEYEVSKLKRGIKDEVKHQASEQISEEKAEYLSPVETVENKQNIDFASLFLENISNKIGAIALLIGLGIFVKIIAPFLVFTPMTKILLATVFSAITLFLGLKLNKQDKFQIYSEVVIGIGISALFITLYCASSILYVINMPTATFLAVLLTCGGFYLADRLKTTSAIWIMLVAGFLNPIFINRHLTPEFLCGYLLLLNIITSAFVSKNPDKSYINIVNIVASTIFVTVFRNWGEEINIASKVFFAALTLMHTALAFAYKVKFPKKFQTALYSALAALLICTFFDITGNTRIAFLALEGLAVAYFARQETYLKHWMAAFFIIASACALFNDLDYGLKALGYFTVIVPLALATTWIENNDQFKEVCHYLNIGLGFFLIHETAVFIKDTLNIEYIVSIFWLLYSGYITIFGILKDTKVLKYSGVCLCILTTLRIFFIDIAELASIYKTIALFTLGIVLMLVSFLYTKYKK